MRSCSMRALSALVAIVFLDACASTTIIHSDPEGAKIYIDGESRGTTPYTHSDTKIIGSTTSIRLVKDGYQDTTVSLQRNEEFAVGPCIGGVLVLFPFLWVMGYRADHRYELTPLQPKQAEELPPIPLRLAEADL